MTLKRKRSASELCSSPLSSSASSTSSSPPHRSSFAMFGLGSMSGPAHLNSRTLKRFRDSRPSEQLVHQRTLGLLYSAQQRPSEVQQILDQEEHLPPTIITPAAHTTDRPAPQQSLHRFWNIHSAPRTSSSTIDQPMHHSSPDCEDCGGNLAASSEDGMDLDGVEDFACSSCGKNVCFSCSVSNLGEQKHCLRCAGRRPAGGVGGVVGWVARF
ncbi:hypothetical protein ACRE_043670 [Hapsidospora chrysogenum ATCC 11550]|uniref:Uncharacterized protein n=1 Tax=Hapsidospora chrysogenum (strain ATCC 11550 / CBS 779.69 / DSM 880 / IAM 14645 / JCM 23072 / IMI 49137) TaxID=857340 RepID=A0A086T6A6_HAPC1|nr:hypothetical protein ACRE_043670 [Hapsidospora chrysogenum ATCC 11550]